MENDLHEDHILSRLCESMRALNDKFLVYVMLFDNGRPVVDDDFGSFWSDPKRSYPHIPDACLRVAGWHSLNDRKIYEDCTIPYWSSVKSLRVALKFLVKEHTSAGLPFGEPQIWRLSNKGVFLHR